nr:phospholipase D-like domain-containing protein [Sphingomonas laterariae]
MTSTPKSIGRVARATRMSIIVDAADYFRHARAAMLKARRRILLIGWDFDARIDLAPDSEAAAGEPPHMIGDFIYWLVQQKPELEVNLLRWDMGAIKSLFRGKTAFTVAKWMAHPRIAVKLDGHHPTGGSHHQKIIVIDDCFAFCGGIDMTDSRWDTRDHADEAPHRIHPDGSPYGPWHDATSAIEGPAAALLGKLARDRWKRAGGKPLTAVRARHDCWPEGLAPQFNDVDVTIARTIPRMPGQRARWEVEQLYLDHIARARRFIYAESQYFASRRIAQAMAKRLAEKDGPEIVIVNPESAEGWLEPLAMDTARARLFQALRHHDRHDRLRLYHPVTRDGAPIYVHAKILIVDDMILRVGSSNMNNRSMRLDTECDVAIDRAINRATDGHHDLGDAIAAIRDDLLAEHLGTSKAAVAASIAGTGSIIATIEKLRFTGRSNARDRRRRLVPYAPPDLSDVEAWLADNEVLDPENPDDMFEAMGDRGLLRHLRPKGRRG